MKYPLLTLAAAGVWLVGCDQKAATPATSNHSSSGSSPMSAPADYVGALGKAKQSAAKVADVSSLSQAIETFRAEQGRNPKDLNELVQQKYLPRLPDAPYGMKFDYDATAGTVKVVSQ